ERWIANKPGALRSDNTDASWAKAVRERLPSSARGAASQTLLRVAGTSLLLGRRFEQAERSGHLADGPVRVIGPEDAAVFRLGVAISDPIAEGLTEGSAVAQAR